MSRGSAPALNLFAVDDTPRTRLAEGRIGKNSDPKSKCDASRTIVSRNPHSLDVDIMKPSFVDATDKTNMEEVFRYYKGTVGAFKQSAPRVTIVHPMNPLTLREGIVRRLATCLLGRENGSDAANRKRAASNALLLKELGHELVFDIATLEATTGDAKVNIFKCPEKPASHC